MARIHRSSFLSRPQPQPLFFALALFGAAVVTACSSSDSSGGDPSAAAGAAGSGGSSSSSMMPSSSSGGAKAIACDEREAVCVQSCPTVSLAVTCGSGNPCPSGYTVDFDCGADPSATPIEPCAAGSARTGAFCAKECPETQPATCDTTTGMSTCASGWHPIADCAK
jgi:hypothetical protein